jgi:Domain of unknown function (DUF4383)
MTSTPTTARTGLSSWTPAQRFAGIFGAVYLVVALAGFYLTGFTGFGEGHDHTLVIFAVNPLHNYIHLALALGWLAAAPRHTPARVTNLMIGVVLGLVTVLGILDVLGFLGMSGMADPDNFLHLATASLALYFGSVGATATDRR